MHQKVTKQLILRVTWREAPLLHREEGAPEGQERGGGVCEPGTSVTSRILLSRSDQMASKLIIPALFTIAKNWK